MKLAILRIKSLKKDHLSDMLSSIQQHCGCDILHLMFMSQMDRILKLIMAVVQLHCKGELCATFTRCYYL